MDIFVINLMKVPKNVGLKTHITSQSSATSVYKHAPIYHAVFSIGFEVWNERIMFHPSPTTFENST